ncbi:unnamed protein product [Rhizophagus irregularis]|uniref:Uncharacterized protein n=1 Tax=Rhizophagus irregularis TaxID=588596 RepID=A0A915ZD26_9GLOM|nr:unnamed protein product [Rhizophagus irregularis]
MPRYVPSRTPQEDDDNYISDNNRQIKKSKTTSTTSKQKATQDIEAIITNLTTNGARNYNNVVFTFPNGGSIGAWKQQINANIPWVRNQLGVPNVIITVTRINRDTGIPSSAYDFSEVLFPIFKFRQRLLHIIWLRICRQNRIY